MTKLALYFTVAAVAIAPTLSFAKDDDRSRETLADQQRCAALTKQWSQVSTSGTATDSAKKDAAQGEVLCRAGKYDEGSRTLENALKQVSVKPM
jgi:hypothetical protein